MEKTEKCFRYSKADLDNHSNQLNPNNEEYLRCRGLLK